MYAWTVVIKRREHSLTIGFSFGSDMSCYGRLRYRRDKSRMELLRMPKGEVAAQELRTFVKLLEDAVRQDRIPWQTTCIQYRSVKDEEEFCRMMHEVHVG